MVQSKDFCKVKTFTRSRIDLHTYGRGLSREVDQVYDVFVFLGEGRCRGCLFDSSLTRRRGGQGDKEPWRAGRRPGRE